MTRKQINKFYKTYKKRKINKKGRNGVSRKNKSLNIKIMCSILLIGALCFKPNFSEYKDLLSAIPSNLLFNKEETQMKVDEEKTSNDNSEKNQGDDSKYKEVNAFVKDKYGNELNLSATNFKTDLGNRYFAKEVKDKYLPDSKTIFDIGSKLFKNQNFKVTAYFGEYYLVNRDKINNNASEGENINSKNNSFKGIHEGLDMKSSDDSVFYNLKSGYLINDGSDNFGTIAIYLPNENKTVLYLHSKKSFYTLKDKNDKIFIKEGEKLGIQGDSGLNNGADHVHIEVVPGIKRQANSSNDVKIYSLCPYNVVK